MQKWEYLSLFLHADTEKHYESLGKRFPGQTLAPHSPRALVPELNLLGEEGWELVSIEPVAASEPGDLLIHNAGSGPESGRAWSYTYLCVFKRPKA